MSPRQKGPTLTPSEVARYETLLPLFQSMHEDVTALSLKSQSAVLSKSRIEMINRLLGDVKTLLAKEPTASYLSTLDEAIVPQNADALLIFGQFKAALEQFKDKYTYLDDDEDQEVWRIK